MNYRVRHVSTYRYVQRVPISYNRVCLTPRNCPGQQCVRYSLTISPTPGVSGAPITDCFGNELQYFTVQDPHDTLEIVAESEVHLSPGLPPDAEATPPWEHARDAVRAAQTLETLDALQFALPGEHLALTRQLRDYARPSFSPGTPVLAGAIDLMHRIHREFAYDDAATTIATPLEEVLSHRHGVCQDFAQLHIGCLRALGLAARYVSGYIAPWQAATGFAQVGAQASHAWLSVFVPGHGWVDLDPTNDVVTGNEHITLAWGRHYDDVAPICGVILGGGTQFLDVWVEVWALGGGNLNC